MFKIASHCFGTNFSQHHSNLMPPTKPAPSLKSSLKKRKSTSSASKHHISFQFDKSKGSVSRENSSNSLLHNTPVPSQFPSTFSILTLNTHSFSTTNYQSNFAALLKFLKVTRPDVIALQQCYHVSGKNSGANLIKQIAKELNYFYVFGDSLRVSFGNVILSRFKMWDSANCQVMRDEKIRAMLRVRLRLPVPPRKDDGGMQQKAVKEEIMDQQSTTSQGSTSTNDVRGSQLVRTQPNSAVHTPSPLTRSPSSPSSTLHSRSVTSTKSSLSKNYFELDIYTTDLRKSRQNSVPQLREMLEQMVAVQSSNTPHIICGDFDSLCLDDFTIDYLNSMKERWRQTKMHGIQFDAHFMLEKMGYIDTFKESNKENWEECQDSNCATGTIGRIPVRTDFIWMDALCAAQSAEETHLRLQSCQHLDVESLGRKVVLATFEIVSEKSGEEEASPMNKDAEE